MGRSAEFLFPPSILSHDVSEPHLHIRPLCDSDYEKGFPKILSVLTTVGPYTKSMFMQRFRMIRSMAPRALYIIVVEDSMSDRIIGAGTLLVELKFIHGASRAGHIEDIVVAKDVQKRGLGKEIIKALVQIGRDVGCYKVSLNCSKENEAFYRKCGFEPKEIQMTQYFDDRSSPSAHSIRSKL